MYDLILTHLNEWYVYAFKPLHPTINNYVLLSFTISMLEIIQPLNSAIQLSMAVIEAVWFVQGMGLNDG